MKALATLIKISQKNIDKLILEKKICLQHIADLNQSLEAEISNMEYELKEYATSEYAIFLEKYKAAAKEKIEQIRFNIGKVEGLLEEINNQLHDAFSEMKRYELILENKKLALAKGTLLKENKSLDEMNIMRIASRTISEG